METMRLEDEGRNRRRIEIPFRVGDRRPVPSTGLGKAPVRGRKAKATART